MSKKDDDSSMVVIRDGSMRPLPGRHYRQTRHLVFGICCLSVPFVVFFSSLQNGWEEHYDTVVTQPLTAIISRSLESAFEIHDEDDSKRIVLPELSESSLRGKRALSDAVTTMKCMLLPGCYPDVPCADNTPPMKLPQGKSWVSH
jgi:hypothetical protein